MLDHLKKPLSSEADLARLVATHLEDEGWDVYAEVKLSDFLDDRSCPSGIADLVTVRGHLAMVVEVKKSFSLALLEQAIEWSSTFPMVAMAVPSNTLSRRNALRDHLQSHFGLGILSVSQHGVRPSPGPRLLRHNLHRTPAIREALDPRMKVSTAGAASTYRHSPYQSFTWYIRTTIAIHGPMTQRELTDRLVAEHGQFHYTSIAVMKQQIGTAIRQYEPDLSIGHDGMVRWNPNACPHGDAYVAKVEAVVSRHRP